MSSSAEPSTTGLRERKKARTRAALRDHGLRLFREQGYHATTIEQIAEAAEVSPSTFFRYFPSKEDIVLVDDLDAVLIAAFETQPTEKSPIVAVRDAIAAVLAGLTDEDREREQQRQELMLAVPELRATMMDEFRRNIDMVAEVVARRLGRPANDFEVRVFAGAVIGAAISTFEIPTRSYEDTLRALDFLAAGLPLVTD
ncbi:MAG TPA: TetR family transcriptional regulator [Jatrophihabitantaceae bacterium]|jgi:AcrR family transcriptional regulator